jgi:hypothetical protein
VFTNPYGTFPHPANVTDAFHDPVVAELPPVGARTTSTTPMLATGADLKRPDRADVDPTPARDKITTEPCHVTPQAHQLVGTRYVTYSRVHLRLRMCHLQPSCVSRISIASASIVIG